MALCLIPTVIALGLMLNTNPNITLIAGLLLFGILFAINSSLHSYLIVSYADREGASLDIGFYYMANAMGRLIGTLLSGWVFQAYGLSACLFISTLFIMFAMMISYGLPKHKALL
jgi:predicted MFS family arabinose efflux permease